MNMVFDRKLKYFIAFINSFAYLNNTKTGNHTPSLLQYHIKYYEKIENAKVTSFKQHTYLVGDTNINMSVIYNYLQKPLKRS